MPKKTFYNLSEDKKTRIIDAAYSEFIEKPYKKVNIRSLSARAQINVASFYQYFDDKEDLYLHLACMINDKIQARYEGKFEYLFLGEYRLNNEELLTEREVAFGETWYQVPEEVYRKFYFGDYSHNIKEYYRQEIMKMKAKGLIRDDVDLEFALHIYITTMFSILLYFREHNITDFHEKQKIKEQFFYKIFLKGILVR